MRLRWWVLLSLGLAALSFGALYYVIFYIWPNANDILAAPQMLVLLLLFLAAGSASIPFIGYLNYRFATSGWLSRDRMRLIRQGSWCGLLAVVLAYLQLVRALNLVISLVLAAVFMLIELFFLTRE